MPVDVEEPVSEQMKDVIFTTERLRQWIEMSPDDAKMKDCTMAAGAVLVAMGPAGQTILGRFLFLWTIVKLLPSDHVTRVKFRQCVLKVIGEKSSLLQDSHVS